MRAVLCFVGDEAEAAVVLEEGAVDDVSLVSGEKHGGGGDLGDVELPLKDDAAANEEGDKVAVGLGRDGER